METMTNLRYSILKSLMLDMADAAFIFDQKGHLDLCNLEGKNLLHRIEIDPEDCTLKKLVNDRHIMGLEDISESFYKGITLKLNSKECKYNCNFGRVYEDGEYIGCFFIFSDFTSQKEQFEEQKYRYEHDEITGFYNKSAFLKYAPILIKDNSDKKYILLYSDVRDFKVVNENYGQDIGNEILKLIAGYLRTLKGEDTIISRLEADHFAICMPQYKFDVDKIKEKSIFTLKMNNVDLIVRNLYGVYKMEKDENIDIANMCERARMALEHDGLDKSVAFYSEIMKENLKKEKDILDHFPMYIRERKFLVYLQPQYDIQTGNMVGAEALVRLKRNSGIVSPYDFINVLEKNGHITELDYYVWEETCRFLSMCLENKSEVLPVSVNVSKRDFDEIDVNRAFCTLTDKYSIPRQLLRIEITEDMIMSDEKMSDIVMQLRKNGFFVEIDDFGSGYASLNLLQNLSIDVVKLGINFIHEDLESENGVIILEGIINLLKTLRMTVIAKGVETKEQQVLLGKLGCDIIQGYYYQRPIPMDDFYKLIR